MIDLDDDIFELLKDDFSEESSPPENPVTVFVEKELDEAIKKSGSELYAKLEEVCTEFGVEKPEIKVSDEVQWMSMEFVINGLNFGYALDSDFDLSSSDESFFCKALYEQLVNNLSNLAGEKFEERIPFLEMEKTLDAYMQLYTYYKRVKKDNKTAFHWAKKAASTGNPKALSTLASMYRSGCGVKQDRKMAKKIRSSIRSKLWKE